MPIINFFNFPAEIRLQIYEELLVSSEPIKFKTTKELSLPPLILHKRCGLCPAALRANKTVHREANELLYTRNRFEFIDLIPTERLTPTDSTAVEYFLNQIGRPNASLLRHICIEFPEITDEHDRLHDDDIRTLELVRENCTGLTILEAPLYDILPLLEFYHVDTGRWEIVDAAFELINSSFREISSLQEIIVHLHTSKDLDDDKNKKLNDKLLQKMRGCGWTTRIVLDTEEEESEYDSDIDSDDFLGIETEDSDNYY
jgi:hypothetical protein